MYKEARPLFGGVVLQKKTVLLLSGKRLCMSA
jgi:hypothetical protein